MTHLYNRFPIEFVFRSTICMKPSKLFIKIKLVYLVLEIQNLKIKKKLDYMYNAGILLCLVILETYNIEIGLISGL